jgi:hypothetical protein
MSQEKIIAVVVDTKLLTLYRPDGSTIEIPQGDPRVRSIIDQVLPIVESGGIADINLELPSPYKDFETETKGIVKLFRVFKKAVKHIFDPEMEQVPLAPGVHGPVPETRKRATAIDEILSQAQPVSDPNFDEHTSTEDHTMIAVIGKGEDRKIIPEVDKLKDQMAYSAKGKNTIGMQNLLTRLAKVIENRGHSVQDVLRFLERADLPIADDGSIIAYKVLSVMHSMGGKTFVDCHTGKVQQMVGSFVTVSEDLVDRDRRNECSNGLHIARRSYIKNFSGSVCVLTKIAPEDIITVPHNDPNKVRVCGYHILFQLSDDAYAKLKRDTPMTSNPEAARMVSDAIAGRHINRREEVRINGQRGTDVVITPLDKNGQYARRTPDEKPVTKHTALDDHVTNNIKPAELETAIGKMNQVVARSAPVEAPKQEAPLAPQKVIESNRGIVEDIVSKTTGGSRQDKAQALYRAVINAQTIETAKAAISNLIAMKKAAKVSWYALGISSTQINEINDFAQKTVLIPGSYLELVSLAPAPQPEPEEDEPVEVKPTKAMGVKEQAMSHYNRGEFAQLWDFKMAKKKSWEVLGFSGKQITQIMNNKSKG